MEIRRVSTAPTKTKEAGQMKAGVRNFLIKP